jgi:hypothetical protein
MALKNLLSRERPKKSSALNLCCQKDHQRAEVLS